MIVEIVFDHDEASNMQVEQELLIKALQAAALKHNIEDTCEVVITITDDAEIQELNRVYRGKDVPTDVLSFAYAEADEPEVIGSTSGHILGDIIISIDRVRAQAVEYGHSLARELSYLAVHGFLHLLGYDHMTMADKKEMRLQEKEIMDRLDLQRTKTGEER